MARRVTEKQLRLHIKADRQWWLVDCENQPLGWVCRQIAQLAQGKHKPYHTNDVDCGDNVVVINAKKVAMTNGRMHSASYFRHTGYPGSEKWIPFLRLRERHPEILIKQTLRQMWARIHKRKERINTRVRVYPDARHPHGYQNPTPVFLNSLTPRVGYGGAPYDFEMDWLWDCVVPFIHPEGYDEAKKFALKACEKKMGVFAPQSSAGLAELIEPSAKFIRDSTALQSYVQKYGRNPESAVAVPAVCSIPEYNI
ncbi:50S ribosomal protein L13 [Porphyridium purpureum]|uniref:50S ribosomal protein L13 n=1 Tax=Porphyridium purpureum TaxID=35688 RepID=A0A5J4Z5K8_PORPP|nr:50S ribosomal protein L13 [Porphyridium purpureum]|eukprot:POR8619..scf295_1